jgi:hypothetical protein
MKLYCKTVGLEPQTPCTLTLRGTLVLFILVVAKARRLDVERESMMGSVILWTFKKNLNKFSVTVTVTVTVATATEGVFS